MSTHETKEPDPHLEEARRRSYEEQLQLLGPRPAISFTFGGDARRGLQLLLSGDRGTGQHYVYLHRGARDEVFYVGKGKGDRAYSRDRDPLWHHYLETRCNGQYTVEIVRRYETEDKAFHIKVT